MVKNPAHKQVAIPVWTGLNSTRLPRHTEIVSGKTVAGVGVAGAVVGLAIGALVGGLTGALPGGLIGLMAGCAIGALVSRKTLTGPIADPAIQAAMRRAWADSDADNPANRHEEGGYIVRRADGSLGVERWPVGGGANIHPPARDAAGRYNSLEVLGEFHTHPNPPLDETGTQWVQEPHWGDTGAIAAEGYPGDSYIISWDRIYRIRPDGTWDTLGSRTDIIRE